MHKPDAPIEATFTDVVLTIRRSLDHDRTRTAVTETPNPHLIDADTITGEMHPIRRAVLALGSNLGDRLASLQGAITSLADTPDVWLTAVSPVYETEPVDAPDDAPPFLNAVVLIDTTLPAHRLLDRALAIEDAFDRERSERRQRAAHPRRRPDRGRRPAHRHRRPPAAAPPRGRARLRAPAVARPRARRGAPRRRRRSPTCSTRATAPASRAARRPGARDPVSGSEPPEPPDSKPADRPTSGSCSRSPRRPGRPGGAGLVVGWLARPAERALVGLGADRHLAPGARPVLRRGGPGGHRPVAPAGHDAAQRSGPRRTRWSTGSCWPGPAPWSARSWRGGYAGYALTWLGQGPSWPRQRIIRSALAAARGGRR